MHHKSLILSIFFVTHILNLVACKPVGETVKNPLETEQSSQNQPVLRSSSTRTSIRTLTPSETSHPSPTQKSTETPIPTQTLFPLELTLTAYPTVINPTAAPISAENSFLNGLVEKGYKPLFGTSILGPGGYIYSAYLFFDSSFHVSEDDTGYQANYFPEPFRNIAFNDSDTTEGCRLVFYRSDGSMNEMLYSFGAPKYPEGSIYHGYPVSCTPNDWNRPYIYGAYPQDDDIYRLLNLHGVWSDINQNGQPEIAIQYQFCPNACLNYGAVSIHFYEIQTTSKIVDITADLPGVIEPFSMIHSKDPLNFLVYDPTLWYCYKWCIIDTWWIYAWNGFQFVDKTADYSEEYIAQADKVIQRIQQQKRQDGRFRDSELLSILYIYEKAGLRKEGFEVFMEITDPASWLKASLEETCWLQVARAIATEDFNKGGSFKFPPLRLEMPDGDFYPYQMINNFPVIDLSKYDISACSALFATLTPSP